MDVCIISIINDIIIVIIIINIIITTIITIIIIIITIVCCCYCACLLYEVRRLCELIGLFHWFMLVHNKQTINEQ